MVIPCIQLSQNLLEMLLVKGTKWGLASSGIPSATLSFRPEPLNLLTKARKHFTQRLLAQKLDVNRKTISRWENRQIPLPLYIEPALREILRGICESPRHQSSFTFIDLFAGIGGIRKGFEAVGGRAVFTSEWNPWAQKTYAANFGDEGQLIGDIVGFPTEEIPDHDVLSGGFPCQPFSIAGVSKKNSLGRPQALGCATRKGGSRDWVRPPNQRPTFNRGIRGSAKTRVECCLVQRSERMPKIDGWSREQLIVALKLYCEMPFGKMHSRNPEIVRYAKLIDRTPSALAMKLTNFASLDPEIRSTGRKGLGGASKADRQIWEEMTSDWDHLATEIARVGLLYAGVNPPDEGQDTPKPAAQSYVGGTRTALVEARVGQDFFRRSVLSAYGFRCCITGLAVPELLVASHIVPWRDDPSNRLNPRNGLCLSAIHDRAFDIGLITFSDDLCLLLSSRIHRSGADSYFGSSFRSFVGKAINPPEKLAPDPGFLKHHRENIFRR